MPDGLIFVDTVSGQPIAPTTPESDLATVSVSDGAATRPSGVIRGWTIVNGTLSVAGAVTLEGFAFAADRFSQTGAARVLGTVMAGHVRSTAPSIIDARPPAGPALSWNCEAGRTGGGVIQARWIIKPGTYREAAS